MLKKEDVLIEDSRSNRRGNKFTGLVKLTDSANWRSPATKRGAWEPGSQGAKTLGDEFRTTEQELGNEFRKAENVTQFRRAE
jgi:hypothetical protein